ncbi:MAG: hypothetical protein H6Q19_212 [Bacteroidetes bacterium]|nr:hypothetical protein [Bacteroidota bacterium]
MTKLQKFSQNLSDYWLKIVFGTEHHKLDNSSNQHIFKISDQFSIIRNYFNTFARFFKMK